MSDKVEEVWQEFWKDIVCDESGTINLEQLKKELYDYSIVLNEVPKVYCEITDNLLSKPFYNAETVLGIFRDKYADKLYGLKCLPDDWDNITADCATNEDYKKALFDYLEIEI